MRATVTTGRRRVDVRLPDGVAVVELLPGLAGRLGSAGDDPVLVTADGRTLDPGEPLAAQGVVDGAVLGLVDAGTSAPQRYDDLAEAVADAVVATEPRWPPGTARQVVRGTAVGCLVLAITGLAVGATRTAPPWLASAVTAAMVLVVLAQSGFGWLALVAAGTDAELPVTDPGAPRPPIDAPRIATRVAKAQRLLIAATLAVGGVLTAAAPYAVTTGPAGTAAALACGAVVLLRTRHLHAGRAVTAGVTAGLAGLAATAAALLALQPEGRLPTALAATAAGGVLLAWAHRAPRPSLRLTRAADLTETTLVLALLPLLAVATGLAP